MIETNENLVNRIRGVIPNSGASAPGASSPAQPHSTFSTLSTTLHNTPLSNLHSALFTVHSALSSVRTNHHSPLPHSQLSTLHSPLTTIHSTISNLKSALRNLILNSNAHAQAHRVKKVHRLLVFRRSLNFIISIPIYH